MAETPSTMLPLGTRAPGFELPDAAGKRHGLAEIASGARGLVVAFICNHCPYVKLLKREFADLARASKGRGVATVAINANDVEKYPDDGPEQMAEDAREFGYTFPYLLDRDQSAAKAYRAACTPDFFLFDADLKLVYRGQFDGARPGNGVPPTGESLRAALDALLEGRPVDPDQRPSIGCNIKWKPGNAPGYA